MSKRLELHPEAMAELVCAVAWYEAEREGLGEQFQGAFEDAAARARDMPSAGSPVPRRQAVRSVPVGRFPYRVVYVERAEHVLLLAIEHTHRRPGYWRRRLRS